MRLLLVRFRRCVGREKKKRKKREITKDQRSKKKDDVSQYNSNTKINFSSYLKGSKNFFIVPKYLKLSFASMVDSVKRESTSFHCWSTCWISCPCCCCVLRDPANATFARDDRQLTEPRIIGDCSC